MNRVSRLVGQTSPLEGCQKGLQRVLVASEPRDVDLDALNGLLDASLGGWDRVGFEELLLKKRV